MDWKDKDERTEYLIKFRNIRERYPYIYIPNIKDRSLEEIKAIYEYTVKSITDKQKRKEEKRKREKQKERNYNIISLYYCIQKNDSFDTLMKDAEFHRLLEKLLPERVVNTITGNYQSYELDNILQPLTISDRTAICQLLLDFFTLLYP